MRASLLSLLLLAAVAGCRKGDDAPAPAASASAKSAPVPVDRLAPDEVAPGKSQVFGFAVPREMEIKSQGIDSALLEGDVAADALVLYVRDRVAVSHVEIGAGRTVFPKARIKEGPPDRLYQLEVIPRRGSAQLLIVDVTAPSQPAPASNEEGWRRAGRSPDGKPLNPGELR